MKYPAFLKEKGAIGLIAPSFGCETEPYKTAFENARHKWEKMGFRLDPGPNCYAGEGIGISNTPERCGREFTEYYLRKENDVLISCGGGELMCEILEHVDFDALKRAEPKWFMGYSDNTNMTFLLTTLCDVASIYGPCASAFGMEPWHEAVYDALALLQGRKQTFTDYGKWEKEGLEDALAPYQCTEDLKLRAYLPADSIMKESGSAAIKGRLIGGCMDCLVNLVGTKFDQVGRFVQNYQEDGFVWFLESCDLNVFGIRRAMWQMEQAGWFEHVKGFLIGRPLCHGQEMMGLDQYQAVLPVALRHKVPVIMDADLGHLPPMIPLVSGSMAKINMEQNHLTVNMEYK